MLVLSLLGYFALIAFTVWYALRRSKRKLEVPEWNTKPKTLAEVHAEEHEHWMDDFKALLSKNCDHLYHHQNWYTCMMCGTDEHWEYKEGCKCRYEEIRAISDRFPRYALIERVSWCKHHGTDFYLWPISDRKHDREYGPSGSNGDKEGVRASMALQAERRPIRKLYQI